MRAVLAGGGTGGHVFPGIALARAFSSPDRVHFLCTPREFDRDHLGGLDFGVTPVGRWSVRRALRVLREARPDVVIGLGGGGAFPGLVAALLRGVPFVCLEQNVLPGRLTRAASMGASRIYAQWRESKKFLPGLNGRFVWTGSPLRSMERRDPWEARKRYGLAPGRPTILVLGGSQGAEALNLLVPEASAKVEAPVQFLHMTGRADRCERVEKAYREAGARAAVVAFEREMEWAYSASDMAVSRAGALALAELCRFRVPAILVPYPHARDDHQAHNARALARAGGAVMVREARFTAVLLAEWAFKLVSKAPVFDNMRLVQGGFDRPGAIRRILEDLQECVLR